MLIYAVTLNIFSIPCNRNKLIKIIQFMFAIILHWHSNRGTAYCYATGIAIVTAKNKCFYYICRAQNTFTHH